MRFGGRVTTAQGKLQQGNSLLARAHRLVQRAGNVPSAHEDDSLAQLLAQREDHVLQDEHLVNRVGALLQGGSSRLDRYASAPGTTAAAPALQAGICPAVARPGNRLSQEVWVQR